MGRVTCYCSFILDSKSFPQLPKQRSSSNFCPRLIHWSPGEDYIPFLGCKSFQQMEWQPHQKFLVTDIYHRSDTESFQPWIKNITLSFSLPLNLCMVTFPSLSGYNSWNKKHPQLHNGCMAVSGTQQALLSFMLQQHNWLPHKLNHTFIVSCHSCSHSCRCCHSSSIIHRDNCLAAISTRWL